MEKLRTQRWTDPSGASVYLEESHELPIVDVEFAFRTGGTDDPEKLSGLMRSMWRVIRMGTKQLSSSEVEERVARLGGRLAVFISTSSVRVQGSVIRRNLEPFFALLSDVISSPAFRPKDLVRARNESLAELIGIRDDDRTLAGRVFRRKLFGKHPYARAITGDAASLKRIRVEDLEEHYAAHVSTKHLVVGFAGDITEREAKSLTRDHLSAFPKRKVSAPRVADSPGVKGRHIIIVDKPERTQTQILVGGLGVRVGEKDHVPLLVGNVAFGGTFTSRLTQEVREKRGWSYGASSHLGADRARDAWYMSTAPATTDAVACIALELELLEGLHKDGLSREEFARGRDYLVNSHCFELDTAQKRLEPRIDEAVFGLPFGTYAKGFERVRTLKREEVQRAIRKHVPREDLVIALVATAKDVRRDLEKLPGVASVEVVPHKSV